MRLTGNKGEWSEIYVLFRLLAMGRLYAADENRHRDDTVFFPILKIIRQELFNSEQATETNREFGDDVVNTSDNSQVEYRVQENTRVHVYVNGRKLQEISGREFNEEADHLYREIKNSPGSFSSPSALRFMERLRCFRLTASSSDKTDISIQLRDVQTGYSPICNFSIKSDLGHAPTLLNASGATNFAFRVTGLDKEQIEEINAIKTREKILDRIRTIQEWGAIKDGRAVNRTFATNLMLIDSRMEEIISHVLLVSYTSGKNDCKEVIEEIEKQNPMGFPSPGFYIYKFKKLLCSVALGLKPSTAWDGRDEANGGYIIVTQEGDVLAYHIYNRNFFEDYLLENTRFERGSTSRHQYASIYEKDGKFFCNLNLQIRFKS